MDDASWKLCLKTCRTVLGSGSHSAYVSESWCAFTTFSRLKNDIYYWYKGLPDVEDLLDSRTKDGGVWSQPFDYSDLAHLVIPAKFSWDGIIDGEFKIIEKSKISICYLLNWKNLK